MPLNHPVFDLVPPEFGQYVTILYQSMGSPAINSDNVWNIYWELLHQFECLDNAEKILEECQVYLNVLDDQVNLDDEVPPAGIELYGGPDDQLEDADGNYNYYMGGVNNGRGLGMSKFSKLLSMIIISCQFAMFVRFCTGKSIRCNG